MSAGGTPRLALALSSAVAVALILTGTFEQIIALATVLFLLIYIATYVAVFVLRRREPDLPRPYRAFGFPFTTGIVLPRAACSRCSPPSSRIRARPGGRRTVARGVRARVCLDRLAQAPGAARAASAAASEAAAGPSEAQSKSVGSSGSSACWNMRSICAAVVRPSDRGGSASRAKNDHFARLDARRGRCRR